MPAIRTLKISVFYPKNNQKSQILLALGSSYTSDDSPTVTQIYLAVIKLLSCYCGGHNNERQKFNRGWGRFSATPVIRTLKINIFYPKNSQNSQILLLVGSRHTSDDSPTVTQIYQRSLLSLYVVLCWRNITRQTTIRVSSEVNCNARHKDPKNKCILPQK